MDDIIDRIVHIIGVNSVEKDFAEYGKGVFATHLEVQKIAEEIAEVTKPSVTNNRDYVKRRCFSCNSLNVKHFDTYCECQNCTCIM